MKHTDLKCKFLWLCLNKADKMLTLGLKNLMRYNTF